jgi:hypothetical protein
MDYCRLPIEEIADCQLPIADLGFPRPENVLSKVLNSLTKRI